MASLNTLRTRGGVVVSVVIGIALLAFLVGDFAPKSCNETTVGEIDGRKVDYMEYLEQTELHNTVMRTLMGRESTSTQEQDQIREMTWQSLIVREAYQPGFNKLGLWPSEAEQIDMTSGVYISRVMEGTFRGASGQIDKELMRQVSESNEASMIVTWSYLKEQMNVERAMSKYMSLVRNSIAVTDLEVGQALALANRSVDAKVVKRPYSSIPDSTITVTKGEVKAYYDAHRRNFKQEASREIEYVVFDMLPSEEDYAEAKKYIDQMATEFEASAAPMQYAVLNSQIRPDERFLKEAQVEGPIALAVWGKPEAIYGPVLSGDTYTVARQGEVKMAPDSLGAMHILLEKGETALADSLMGLIRRGSNFGDLARRFSDDPSAENNGGDLGMFVPEMMVPEFSDAVIASKVGDVFTVESQFGLHVIKTTRKTAPVLKAQIAVIKYRVDPSSHTQQIIYAQASDFMAQAAGSYDNFKKAATEAALSKRVARIRNVDRNVSGISDSRELVRWAFNNEKGQVSDIMEIGGDFIVAAVTATREDGYATVEDATAEIRPVLVRQKKGDQIIASLTGNSIASIEPDTANVISATSVTFAPFFAQGVGMEPAVIGAIASAQQTGVLSKPVRGNEGIYVFEAEEVRNDEGSATSESEKVRLEAMATSRIDERVAQAMSETTDVIDRRVKFF